MARRLPPPTSRPPAWEDRGRDQGALRELESSLATLSLALARLERLAAELSPPVEQARRQAA
jgi:hypothetical protein